MRARDVRRALKKQKCKLQDGKEHEKWICPCGEHSANIPRHNDISPGVVSDTIERMKCLPKGWLQ
jgi:hypothetical protein